MTSRRRFSFARPSVEVFGANRSISRRDIAPATRATFKRVAISNQGPAGRSRALLRMGKSARAAHSTPRAASHDHHTILD